MVDLGVKSIFHLEFHLSRKNRIFIKREKIMEKGDAPLPVLFIYL